MLQQNLFTAEDLLRLSYEDLKVWPSAFDICDIDEFNDQIESGSYQFNPARVQTFLQFKKMIEEGFIKYFSLILRDETELNPFKLDKKQLDAKMSEFKEEKTSENKDSNAQRFVRLFYTQNTDNKMQPTDNPLLKYKAIREDCWRAIKERFESLFRYQDNAMPSMTEFTEKCERHGFGTILKQVKDTIFADQIAENFPCEKGVLYRFFNPNGLENYCKQLEKSGLAREYGTKLQEHFLEGM